ncbi:MAG: hypothetical protein KVP17_000314 [Porospora cf. gigantea B]|uniref:uncharacterized protein n=1 Tax=Porospora cf. gigantea B TaxID=2853592 RepID=UPI003571A54F|nr:MAG: hypothetical protein KVP17_000314 [Porospora cf. gigantea B]
MSGDELVAALLTMLSSQKPAADPSFGGMDPSSRKEFVASSPFFRRTQHPARPILVLLSAYPFSAPTGVAARFEVPDFLYNSLKDGDPGLPVKISVRVVNVRGVDLDIHDARVQFNGHALPSPAKLPKCRAKHDYLCCYSRGLDLTYGLVRGENEIRLTWRQVDLVSRLEDAGSSSSACFMVLFLVGHV